MPYSVRRNEIDDKGFEQKKASERNFLVARGLRADILSQVTLYQGPAKPGWI
jgi:hypothetical protein